MHLGSGFRCHSKAKMRLVVKQKDGSSQEFRFVKGPIYIGRHPHSQVFLSERTVSRQHTVLYSTQDGKWLAEDLNSANKTYLNGEIVNKAEIKTGDVLTISDFTIEITIETADAGAGKAVHLEDTLVGVTREPQIVTKRIDSEQAPEIKLPAKRLKDFASATEAICEANGLDEMLQVLLRVIAKQFSPYHIWCALRSEATGPMACNAGKSREGKTVQLGNIMLSDRVNEAIEKNHFLLLPRASAQVSGEKIHSAIIAPVAGAAGCFGVIYIDSAPDHERYTVGDLDYLMLLAIHTASIVKNF